MRGKFVKLNLYTDRNDLRDVTLTPTYSAVYGYTEVDLDTIFLPEPDGSDGE